MTNGKMLRRTNNRKTRSLLLMLLVAVISASCNGQDDLTPDDAMKMALSEFPYVDCSTSTQPLSVILAAKVLGVPYKWYKNETLTKVWYVSIDWDKTSFTQMQREELEGKLNCSTTHGSYTNLIDGKVELIIASRDISRTEQKYADGKGVKLITRPVGKDGFVFIVNKANPVNSLTTQDIQDIYTGTKRNWKEVGGNEGTIDPFTRNADSGSQEKMETMVMKGLKMIDWPEMETETMAGPFYVVRYGVNGIAYTPYYYYNIMTRDQDYAKVIAIDGIAPGKETINDGSYPYVSEICASVRADIDKSSKAYELFEYLTNPSGQAVVEESGYVPLRSSTGIKERVSSAKSKILGRYSLNGVRTPAGSKGVIIEKRLDNGIVKSTKFLRR